MKEDLELEIILKVWNVNFMKLQVLFVRHVNFHCLKYELFCILVGGIYTGHIQMSSLHHSVACFCYLFRGAVLQVDDLRDAFC